MKEQEENYIDVDFEEAIAPNIETENEAETDSDSEKIDSSDIRISGVLYPPQKVAALLNITPDALRYLANNYAEFLSKTQAAKGKTRQYTDEDIAVLQTIIKYRNRYSASEIKSILGSPNAKEFENEFNYAEQMQDPNLMLNNEYLIKTLTKVMTESFTTALSQQSKMFQQRAELEDKQHAEQIEKLQQTIDTVLEQNKEVLSQNLALAQQLEETNAKLQALEERDNKSGKGFFGFFKNK